LTQADCFHHLSIDDIKTSMSLNYEYENINAIDYQFYSNEAMHKKLIHAGPFFYSTFMSICLYHFLVSLKKISSIDLEPIFIDICCSNFSRVFYQLILRQIQIREMLFQKARKHGGKAVQDKALTDRLTIPVRKYDAEVFRMLIQFVHSGIVTINDKNVCGKLSLHI